MSFQIKSKSKYNCLEFGYISPPILYEFNILWFHKNTCNNIRTVFICDDSKVAIGCTTNHHSQMWWLLDITTPNKNLKLKWRYICDESLGIIHHGIFPKAIENGPNSIILGVNWTGLTIALYLRLVRSDFIAVVVKFQKWLLFGSLTRLLAAKTLANRDNSNS